MEFIRKLLNFKICFIFVTVLISCPSFCEEINSSEDAKNTKNPYEINLQRVSLQEVQRREGIQNIISDGGDPVDSKRPYVSGSVDYMKENLEYEEDAFVTDEKKLNVDEVFNDEKNSIKLETKFINNLKLNGAVQAFIDYNQPVRENSGSLNFTFLDTHLWFTGNILNESTDFKVMFNPLRDVDGYGGVQTILSDVYIQTKMSQNTKLLIGQSRTPIGVDGSLSQYSLPFVHRSQIARNFSNIRALGVKYMGNYKYADFNVGVYDSTRLLNDLFQGAETTAWANFKPLAGKEEKYGKLNLGTGINHGKREYDYTVAGLYAGYEYRRFSANIEYSHADGSNGTYNRQNKADGLYGTVAYFVHPKVQLLARYDVFDPNINKHHDKSEEYTLGVNYFLKGEKIKLVANYVFKNCENTINSNKFLLMTQVLF